MLTLFFFLSAEAKKRTPIFYALVFDCCKRTVKNSWEETVISNMVCLSKKSSLLKRATMGYVLSKIRSLIASFLPLLISQNALTFTCEDHQMNAMSTTIDSCQNADSRADLLAIVPPISVFTETSSSLKEKSIRDLNKESATFMWFQLLIETLTRMPLSSEAKDELLTECRQQYQNNPSEMNKIEQFENECSPANCIHWYTRDCFLYRLLNQAVRTENIDEILKFRYFIRQMTEQLSVLHKDYVEMLRSLEFDSMTVYRGQTISAKELQKLRVRQ